MLEIDVRTILPAIHVPTLVLHRQADVMSIENGKLGVPDCDHLIFPGDRPRLCGDIEEFVTGHREATAPDSDRVLATVLLADIVDSTRRAAEMGDQAWRRMLDEHDEAAQRIVVQRPATESSPPSTAPDRDPLRAGIRSRNKALGLASASWAPHRRNRIARWLYRRHRSPCGGPSHGPGWAGRSSCLARGYGPRRGCRIEVFRPRNSRAQWPARTLGPTSPLKLIPTEDKVPTMASRIATHHDSLASAAGEFCRHQCNQSGNSTPSKKLCAALRAPCGDRNGWTLDCARKGAAVTILVAGLTP